MFNGMIQHSKINFVFVAIIFYHEWPKIMLRSLREHFTEEVILINHLDRPLPTDYYDDKCTVLNGKIGRLDRMTHGAGIDTAVEFLKKRGDRYFIHIEPDCLITGKDWANGLVSAVESGAVMSGIHKLPFGPIHPCPTIWDINRTSGSFDRSNRTEAINQQIFNYKDMVKWFIDIGMSNDGIWFWCHFWDCGIKNWYMAALDGLAIHSTNSGGFRHFFNGMVKTPTVLEPGDFAVVQKYL